MFNGYGNPKFILTFHLSSSCTVVPYSIGIYFPVTTDYTCYKILVFYKNMKIYPVLFNDDHIKQNNCMKSLYQVRIY